MQNIVRTSEFTKDPISDGTDLDGNNDKGAKSALKTFNHVEDRLHALSDEALQMETRRMPASFSLLGQRRSMSTINSKPLSHFNFSENGAGIPGKSLYGIAMPNSFTKVRDSTMTVNPHKHRCISCQSSVGTTKDGEGIMLLRNKIEDLIDRKLAQVLKLRATYGNAKVGEITVSQVLGGMRDMIGMNCETSQLDPNHGITYRGLTINELLEKLPSPTPGRKCPYVESVLWLLLTGQIPTEHEVAELSRCIAERAQVPAHVYKVIDQLPDGTHPMTQYILAISAMQTDSVFHAAYRNKAFKKDDAWKLVLEDALGLIAKNALLVCYIYKRTFVDKTIRGGEGMEYDANEDYAANIARLIGVNTTEFKELLRLYITVHADHEGGNVSSHAALLIGSALSDPYLCFAGAMSGLSGPLHGLANQECLAWLKNMVKVLEGKEINVETVTQFAQETLQKGQVIPGYGHAVLRIPDPRHMAFVDFAHRRFPDDPLVKILDVCLEAIPPVLAATGKIKSPHPNVDCSTGILLSHFGINEPEIYTVFFGISRAFGIMSQLVWARALMMPIERPKSHTLDRLEEMCERNLVE